MKIIQTIFIIACLFWLVGCRELFPLPVVNGGEELNDQPVGKSPSLDSNELPAIPQEFGQTQSTELVDQLVDSGSTKVESFHFTFPTQPPEPVSAWRPPLYPVPWEPTPYAHFYFTRPIGADEINWPLANYRYGGVFFRGVVHTGVDIPVKIGTPVIAAGSGRVNWAGYGLYRGYHDVTDPYGLAVVIRHDFGYKGQTLYTVYGHLSRINVAVGQHVDSGDELGLSGATGNVTGPHLHFEVRIGGNRFSRSRNPELWLSPPQGWGVLAGRILDFGGIFIPREEVIIRSEGTGRKWKVISYGGGASNSDGYYKENLVIGDLPSGDYTIWVPRQTSDHAEVSLLPGRVAYFTFRQGYGFSMNFPPTPGFEFKTPEPGQAPTP